MSSFLDFVGKWKPTFLSDAQSWPKAGSSYVDLLNILIYEVNRGYKDYRVFAEAFLETGELVIWY